MSTPQVLRPSRIGWRSSPLPGPEWISAFLTSAFILLTNPVSHKEVLIQEVQCWWCVTYSCSMQCIISINKLTFQQLLILMEQSNNMRVQYITKLSKISAKSIIGSNMRIICRRLKLDNISQLMNIGIPICWKRPTYRNALLRIT